MSGTTTLVRRQLGIRLKRLREKAGKTLADVEAASGVGSPSKLWRIESGRSSVRTGDVRELCALYEASNSVLEPLLALARATKSDGWSEDYDSAVRAGLGLYPSLETDASVIRAYNAELIHDLIQTPDYHRAVTAIEPAPSEFAQTRAERLTACFERASPCRFTAILGEAALVRQIGSPQILDMQVKHLRELADRDEIDVRVLTFAAGAHPGLRGGAFTLLDFDDPEDPDVVYLESQMTARYLEQESQLHAYRELWSGLMTRSLPLAQYLP